MQELAEKPVHGFVLPVDPPMTNVGYQPSGPDSDVHYRRTIHSKEPAYVVDLLSLCSDVFSVGCKPFSNVPNIVYSLSTENKSIFINIFHCPFIFEIK